MLRNKALFERFKDLIEEDVDIGATLSKEDLEPFDRILAPLYEGNQEVHKLQKRLSEKKELGLEEILNGHRILSPIEKIIPDLIDANISYSPYYHLTAKVIFLGDKLDRIVRNEVKELETKFNKKYKLIKDRDSSLVQVKNTRDELLNYLNDFFQLEKCYLDRGLPVKEIFSTQKVFSKYKFKEGKIQKLSAEIDKLEEEYQNLDLSQDISDFVRSIKKKTKYSIFSESLIRECKNVDYVEGIFRLKKLEKDVMSQETKRSLGKKVLASEKDSDEAEKLNNKYPISDNIVYHARNGEMWDVRRFIQSDDAILRAVIKEVPELRGLEDKRLDEIAYECMRFVQENIKYVSDPQNTDHPEEWLFPSETLQRRKGDCEDGTNLMISLMRHIGVPAFKVKNACGEVEEGGHSWPIYLREKDNEWVILDWCYKASDKEIDKRELAKHRSDYRKIWFTFNDEHSWAHESIALNRDYLRKSEEAEKVKERVVRPAKTDEVFFREEDTYDLTEMALGEIDLGSHIKELGMADNSAYWIFSHILRGDFEEDYIKRFNRLKEKLSLTKLSSKSDDINYMRGLKNVLEDSREQNLFLKQFKNYRAYNDMIKQLNDYISRCEELVA